MLHREIAHLHLRDVFRELRGIPKPTIGVALVLTALSYWTLSFYDLLGLRYLRKSLPYARMVFTSFIAYAFGHNLGLAAFTGAAIRLRLYASAGLTAIDVVTVQGFCSLTSGLGLATIGGLSLLLEPEQLRAAVHLPAWWTRAVGIALLALVVAYALGSVFNRRMLEFRGWQLRFPRPSVAFPQIALGVLDLSIAAAVLWVLLPPEANITLLAFLGAYAAAVTAGIISHVPGGIGVFETVIILAIPQVPASALLGSMLVYRAVYYLAPLAVSALLFGFKELEARRESIARAHQLASLYIAPVVAAGGGHAHIRGRSGAAGVGLDACRGCAHLHAASRAAARGS